MKKPTITKRIGHDNQPIEGFIVETAQGSTRFNGSWYRGEHTNFIPSKGDLKQGNAVYDYFLKGLVPEQGYIRKETPIR